MTIDWNHFTPWASLAGGILLGLASAMFILVSGRILGISGIVGGLFRAASSAPENGQLLREHLRQECGRHRILDEDRPKRTPLGTLQLLARAANAGTHIGTFCAALHARQGEPAIRRILGILSFHKKYGVERVDQACAAALELDAYDSRFVRRYLEHQCEPPVSLRQVDPLIRQLTLYRDLIEERTKETNK